MDINSDLNGILNYSENNCSKLNVIKSKFVKFGLRQSPKKMKDIAIRIGMGHWPN